MSETDQLNELVEDQYNTPAVTLRPVHQFVVEGRGVYRVAREGQPAWLLRAFHHAGPDPIAWLANSAATLLFLEQQGYPAPKVVRTVKGTLIGRYQGWSSLMLTFIEGVMAENILENLRLLGALLARLHNLDVSKAAAVPSVQGSRFQPDGEVMSLLDRLETIKTEVPPELQPFYDVCLEMFQRVSQWRNLPTTILHTDCWIHNAIQTPGGQLVLVDWDGAGLGPAVLDVAYLLVACHIGLPTWPRLIPNEERIKAVVAGYCQERMLTPKELEHLLEAVRFTIIYHDARDFSQMLQDETLKARNLQRFQVRYPAAEEIARHVKIHFEAGLS
jgi:Ser/Thr protein kinase RdoA (MazF antagonist)